MTFDRDQLLEDYFNALLDKYELGARAAPIGEPSRAHEVRSVLIEDFKSLRKPLVAWRESESTTYAWAERAHAFLIAQLAHGYIREQLTPSAKGAAPAASKRFYVSPDGTTFVDLDDVVVVTASGDGPATIAEFWLRGPRGADTAGDVSWELHGQNAQNFMTALLAYRRGA